MTLMKDDKPSGVYFAPIDLVEDRMRNRVVGICALFCMYLFIGSSFITEDAEPPYELAAQVTFYSSLPKYTTLGPNISTKGAAYVAINVQSTEGRGFYKRKCPALGDVVCDHNKSAEAQVNVTASVKEIAYTLKPRNTLDCSNGPTSPRTVHASAIPYMMIDAACTPALAGEKMPTNEMGTATFTDLAITRGPKAAYTMQFDGGDDKKTQATTFVERRVHRIVPQDPKVGTNMVVEPGVPFSKQPVVQVLDDEDNPVANATVTAFAAEHLNFFQDWVAESDKVDRFDGTALHHVRGQNYALLDGVTSSVTGPDGMAYWHNLTLLAASSKFLYVMFYADGQVASWNDPELRQPMPGKLARPARYTSPIFIRSPVASVVFLDPLASEGTAPATCVDEVPSPTSASASVIDGFTFPEGGLSQPLDGYPNGAPLNTLRVRVLDIDGNPIAGVQVFAVLHTYAGKQLPSLSRPQNERLNHPDYGSRVHPEPKHLHNAVSEPSDADGIAAFPLLSFSVPGMADGLTGLLYHRVAFCTPGNTRPGVYDGCGLSCPFRVLSRATKAAWSVHPTFLRTSTAVAGGEIEPGEPFGIEPPKPVVRFLDADGKGVPTMKPEVWVYDVSVIVAVCGGAYGLTMGGDPITEDMLTDDNYARYVNADTCATTGGGKCLPEGSRDGWGSECYCLSICIVDVAVSMTNLLTIEQTISPGETGLTGDAGFVLLPLSYAQANEAYMYLPEAELQMAQGQITGTKITIPGKAIWRAKNGKVRLTFSDNSYSVWSPPSDALLFSVPAGLFTTSGAAALFVAAAEEALTALADSVGDRRLSSSKRSTRRVQDVAPDTVDARACTTLRPFDALSERMLNRFEGPVRRPDPFAGKVAESQPLLGSAMGEAPIIDFDSWMVPMTAAFVASGSNAATAHYTKEHVLNFLYNNIIAGFGVGAFSEIHPNFEDESFTFRDDGGDAATFMARVLQATSGDLSCGGDELPADSSVACATDTGECADVFACLHSQIAHRISDTIYLEAATYSTYSWFSSCMETGENNVDPSSPCPENMDDALLQAAIDDALSLFPEAAANPIGLQGIKLQALDATGRGVPGLRVRMHVHDIIYPHLPPVATIITCGLVEVSDSDDAFTIEGMKQTAIDQMSDPNSHQATCVTDANGVVEMKVLHPTWRDSGIMFPEFISDASTGTIGFEYVAYQPGLETTAEGYEQVVNLTRACSYESQMDVVSRVGSIEWLDPRMTDTVAQQRTTFNIITDEGALDEIIPQYTDIEDEEVIVGGGFTPSSLFTLAAAADLSQLLDNPDNKFCFNISDPDGEGVAGKMLEYKFVHLPSYLPGWNTKLAPECYTYSRCDIDFSETFPEDGDTSVIRIEEYGATYTAASDAMIYRVAEYPFEPFGTFMTYLSGSEDPDSPGYGCLTVGMHAGHPGLYGVVLSVDGINSSPLLFNVKSKLGSIEVYTQPGSTSIPVASGDAYLEDGSGIPEEPVSSQERRQGEAVTEDIIWRVKSSLEQPPRVKLYDETGAPLANYQVFVRAVHPETLEELPNVLFDASDGAGTSLEGVYNPLGTGRSWPSDPLGMAYFKSLQLFDAPNGTRFKLKIFFKVTAPFEDDLLADFDAAAHAEVSVVTTPTCVAINNHKLTILDQPSTSVSLGAILPSSPSMEVEIELEPFQFTPASDNLTRTLYRLPEALLIQMISLQLQPLVYNGRTLPVNEQTANIDAFSGSRCLLWMGPWTGTCIVERHAAPDSGILLPAGFGVANIGWVVGGVSVTGFDVEHYAYDHVHVDGVDYRIRTNFDFENGARVPPLEAGVFVESNEGTPPRWVTKATFPTFTWRKGLGGGGSGENVAVGGAFEYPGTTDVPPQFDTMTIETEPANIVIMNSPPSTVVVGSAFLLLAKVTISSGMALPGALVTATLVPAAGAPKSPAEFLLDSFNLNEESNGPDAPQINPMTQTATTDSNGVARLIIEFQAGSDGDQIAIQIEAQNGVKSTRSSPITISTPLLHVNSSADGDGNLRCDPPTIQNDCNIKGVNGVGSKGLIADAANVQGYVAFPIQVPIEHFTIPLTMAASALPLKQGDFPQRTLYFRVFTEAGLEAIEKRNEALTNFTDQVYAFEDIGESGVSDALETGLSGDVTGAELRLQQTLEMLSESLNATGEDMLISLVLLLVSGSGPQGGSGTTPNARVVENYVVNIVAGESGVNDTLEVSNLIVEIDKPGKYYLQPVSGGIPGLTVGPIDVGKYNKNTPETIALDYALKIGTTLIIAIAALGNSDWHDARYGVPIGLSMCIVILGLSIETYPYDTVDSIGLWYVITLTVMIVATLSGVIMLLLGKRIPLLKPFAQHRRDQCFAYAKKLLTAPPSEATQLMKELRDKTKHDLATRLYLEKRLEIALVNERSWGNQVKRIKLCLQGKDTDAFYYPSRIYATLLVSLFANAFMMKNTIDMLKRFADSVRDADVATIQAIHVSLTVLQAQFLKLSGNDLPEEACGWAFANVDTLHRYIVGLANAIDIAAVVACSLGIIFYLLAWLTMILDFRGKVIQARRGIWSFQPEKVKLRMSFTYFGYAISNGLLTFVLISFVLWPIVLLLAWELTWKVAIWILENYYRQIILLVVPILVNTVIKKIVTTTIGPKLVIKHRFGWMFYDLYELLLSCVTSITKALVRFCLVCGVTLFSLPRMDVSLFPAWLDYYIALDSGARAYHAIISTYHAHNNPVMRVTVWIMSEDAYKRSHGEEGMVTPKLRKVSNKWNKVWMMYKNPSIAQYTASGSHVPSNAILKAAKKKDIEILRKALQESSGKGAKIAASANSTKASSSTTDVEVELKTNKV